MPPRKRLSLLLATVLCARTTSMGASVPIYLFADIFKVPVIGLPIVNHDNNQHNFDENPASRTCGLVSS